MILKILGLIEFFVAVIALLIHFGFLGHSVGFPVSIYMMSKAFVFRGDIASTIDFFVGAYILGMLLFGLHTFIIFVIIIYLLQKAILSLF